MPFFTKSITDLAMSDLEELLDAGAVENVRLEFKAEPPGTDELLKKVSGFANTYGGYLIIGASASGADGRLEALKGVPVQSGYRQSIVQRCTDGSWPPIQLFVSDPIPSSTNPEAVCYVVFVPESMNAPHFLTKRRGIYIRTDEFSHRFEPRLATYDEIAHLADRRSLAISLREGQYTRSFQRFEHFVSSRYSASEHTTGEIGATLAVAIAPEYPSLPLARQEELEELLNQSRVPWRQVGFPMTRELISQHESLIALNAAGSFSYSELTVWGHLFHAVEVEHLDNEQGTRGMHLNAFLGHLLVNLEHARVLFSRTPPFGALHIRVRLMRVRDKRFVYFPFGNMAEYGPSSPLDEDITLNFSLDLQRLLAGRDEVAKDVIRSLFFALNWASHASEDAVPNALKRATDYNFWRE